MTQRQVHQACQTVVNLSTFISEPQFRAAVPEAASLPADLMIALVHRASDEAERVTRVLLGGAV